jgi:gamma-glutamylcysteine synthetase
MYFWRESIDGCDIAAGGSGQFEVSGTPETVADDLTSHRGRNLKQVLEQYALSLLRFVGSGKGWE